MNISMKSLLVSNIELEKPTAHATCSYFNSSGYASRPIRICLYIQSVQKNANYAYSLITRAPFKIIICYLQDT